MKQSSVLTQPIPVQSAGMGFPVQTPVLAASVAADTAAVGLIVAGCLGVTAFLAKWAFEQITNAWGNRLKDLEIADKQQKQINDEQALAVAHLTKATETLVRQVDTLVELNRQVVLLGERQQTFEQRLQNFGGALQDLQKLYHDAQRESLAVKAELAANYLRREDWQRFANTLEAKMDGIARKQDEYKELVIEVLRK